MKIKSIAQICKKSKTVFLLEDYENGNQWIGDGQAFYPVTGLPQLDEESIFTIFDIPEKQQDKWSFNNTAMPGHISFEDTDPGEAHIDKYGLQVVYHGRQLKSCLTRHGIEFIDSLYLSPLANVMETVELY